MKGVLPLTTTVTPKPYSVPRYRVALVKEADGLHLYYRISCPDDSVPTLRAYLGNVDREHFICAYLDTKNQVIGISTVSIGSLNASIVHPREVFKAALLLNAASVILCHNHPSGCATPSQDDKDVTKRLAEAGEILGIQVLDHIILGDGQRYYSFKADGLIF